MTGPRGELAMVMPMAGSGSRFARAGVREPKPLVDLCGRPFFWWATESVRRQTATTEMVFVVLEEHCREHHVDERVAEYYPEARIVRIARVTAGAAETARIGVAALGWCGPIAVNDCDHAFICPGLTEAASRLAEDVQASLLCFGASSPAYSYARLDDACRVVGTVEKQVVSRFAIAGCYMFASPDLFLDVYSDYLIHCPYKELFISGMFNRLAARGGRLSKVDAAVHCSFGTPEERLRIDPSVFQDQFSWVAKACPRTA